MLLALCAIGWRSESIMQAIGMAELVASPQEYSIESPAVPENGQSTGTSLADYAELAKTDPAAYRRLFSRHPRDGERSEIDKLVNFFMHLKYE